MMVMARRRPGRRYRWVWLTVFSLFIVVGLALWAGFALRDDVVAWVFMQRLDSADPNARAQGAAYLCNHAASNEDLLDAALRRLRQAQDANDHRTERTIVRGLRCAGVWGPSCGGPWLGYLERQAQRGDAAMRATIAVELARAGLHGRRIVRHRPAAQLISRLLNDANAAVRYHGLRAAAACAGPHRLDLIARATNDAETTVRKHAFIMLGLAGVNPNVSWERVLGSPATEQWAMIWADPNLARAVVEDDWLEEQVGPGVIAFLPYALRGTEVLDWARWLSRAPLDGYEGAMSQGYWRAILAAPPNRENRTLLVEAVQRLAGVGEPADAMAAAAVSRVADQLAPMTWTGRSGHRLRELAYYECAPPNSLDVEITGERPDLVRAMMLRSAAHVDPNDALLAFDSDHAAVRHIAVLHAADRFDDDTLRELVRRLVVTWHDNRIMAGAMLAGYTGVGLDILEQRLDREQGWLARQHLKLGLFMQGRIDNFDPAGLLARTDVPRQTVLWAMLYTGRLKAFDELFNPLGTVDGELRAALDRERFIYVLRRHLPGAPQFRVWADPALQQFQVDVLRDWYLMHRSALTFDPQNKVFELSNE